VGLGAIQGVILVGALANGGPVSLPMAAWFFAPFVPMAALSYVPTWFRLRRVLAEGYGVDDLHSSLREHQLARSEEIEYERRQSSPRFRNAMRILLGVSIGVFALGAWNGYQIYAYLQTHTFGSNVAGPFDYFGTNAQNAIYLTMFGSLVGFTFSSVALVGEYVRLHLANRIASRAIGFWKSKWGARIAKLASLGLKKADRPALGMPLLTEVALGRATDHLFEALPKESRRELAALPDTVRRLEADAGRLRDSIIKLDDQLAVFERGGETLAGDQRARVAEELRSTRATAAERLATTVAALESIRLDLLRLQMGAAGIESVTASLEAARGIGDRIAESLAAQAAVEALLRVPSASPASDATGRRSDTPLEGVAIVGG
jgi:hypothetical protein